MALTVALGIGIGIAIDGSEAIPTAPQPVAQVDAPLASANPAELAARAGAATEVPLVALKEIQAAGLVSGSAPPHGFFVDPSLTGTGTAAPTAPTGASQVAVMGLDTVWAGGGVAGATADEVAPVLDRQAAALAAFSHYAELTALMPGGTTTEAVAPVVDAQAELQAELEAIRAGGR